MRIGKPVDQTPFYQFFTFWSNGVNGLVRHITIFRPFPGNQSPFFEHINNAVNGLSGNSDIRPFPVNQFTYGIRVDRLICDDA